MSEEAKNFLEKIIKEKGRDKTVLVAILLAVQDKYRYLPENVLSLIPAMSNITAAAVKEVATYYSHFRLIPAGEHSIKVCIGTACYVKNAEQTYQAFKNYLKIAEDKDTDVDQKFTVSKVACLGCCMLAPAVQIDNLIYGWVEPSEVPRVIENFLKVCKEHGGSPQLPEPGKCSGEVKICLCSSCSAAGADKIYNQLLQWSVLHRFMVQPTATGCTGLSFEAPLIEVTDPHKQVFHYGKVDSDSLETILIHHFKPHSLEAFIDKVINLSPDPSARQRIDTCCRDNKAWLETRNKIVMSYGSQISPCDFKAYCDSGGFKALTRAESLSSNEIIRIITDSKLRGRGGAGFLTGKKWQLAASSEAETKYLVCNADEGDPGAFMDRMLLESVPFRIIEGMMIAALAINANKAIIFVRREYPLAVERIREALKICADQLETEKLNNFDIEVVEGAGAFVCGEETALIAAIEGERGIPRQRPPYPAEKGLFQAPTLINNVETYANVPWIISNGEDEFKKTGTENSPGTKTFALAGKINRGGLIEVPMGMTIRQVINDIGKGISGTGNMKAVQIGGPSGGCLPESLFDLPIDFEALSESGAIMGSGGLVVLDEYDCMVDIARYFLEFTADESCGNCTICRIGSKRMLEALDRLCEGVAEKEDIELIENLAILIKQGSRCGLGKTAPNPVLTTIKYFRDEYIAHANGFCPAGKCPKLFSFSINNDCTGCMICVRSCPVEAIAGSPLEKAEIDSDECVRCGVCRQNCPEKAIMVEKKQ